MIKETSSSQWCYQEQSRWLWSPGCCSKNLRCKLKLYFLIFFNQILQFYRKVPKLWQIQMHLWIYWKFLKLQEICVRGQRFTICKRVTFSFMSHIEKIQWLLTYLDGEARNDAKSDNYGLAIKVLIDRY